LRNFANAPKNDKGIGDIFGACFWITYLKLQLKIFVTN
jgi:hypothetical protein